MDKKLCSNAIRSLEGTKVDKIIQKRRTEKTTGPQHEEIIQLKNLWTIILSIEYSRE